MIYWRAILSLLLASASLLHAAPASDAPVVRRSSSNNGFQILSDDDIQPWVRPAMLERAVYCNAASLQTMTCGAPCDALGGSANVQILATGGDDKAAPWFYVAHDKVLNAIVVAHHGTNFNSFASAWSDLKMAKSKANTGRFPGAPKGAEIHDGFYAAYEKSADTIMNAVKIGLASSSANQVLVVGHSLGASIASLDAMSLRLALPPSVPLTAVVFGFPRTGNKKWADFVDSTLAGKFTWVTNNQDPVPQVPFTYLGYQHPSGGVWIESGNVTLACSGQENDNCSAGNSLSHEVWSDHRGPYFKAAIPMGSGSCPGFEDPNA